MLPTPALSRIAPVLSLPVFTVDRDRYGSFAKAVIAVGERRCDIRSAEAALAGAETSLRLCAARLDALHPGPVYLVSLNGDGINLRVFGARSILGAVLLRLGAANAWTGEDGIWGWRVSRPDLLREQPDANIVEITQHWDGPALPRRRLVSSPVWKDLPQVRAGRVITLPPIAVLGGLSTGLRFAALLTEALTARAR